MSISAPLAVTMMIGTFDFVRSCAADVDARHLRQHHVEQHEVGLVQRRTRRGPRRRRGRPGDVEALAAQADGERLDEGLLVLDDEHGLGHGQATSPMAVVAAVVAAGDGAAGRWSVNVEPTPSTRLDRHRAAVVGGDVAHDGQAEAGAAGLAAAGPVDAVEALEDAVEVGGRDADAVVARRVTADLVAVEVGVGPRPSSPARST